MRFGDICTLRIGHAFRERIQSVEDGAVRVITPADISAHGKVYVPDRGELLTNLDSYRAVEEGELLVVTRGRFGAAVFRNAGQRPCVVHSAILVLRVTDAAVLADYLAIWLNSKAGQRQLSRQNEHAAMPYISSRNLAAIDVPVPPLDRQQAIVNFQHTVRKTNDLYQRKHQLYQQLLDSELVAATSEQEK